MIDSLSQPGRGIQGGETPLAADAGKISFKSEACTKSWLLTVLKANISRVD